MQAHFRSRQLFVAWMAVALAQSALGGVIIVDPQGGPGDTILQQAVNAAVTGDIVLIRAGTYATQGPFPMTIVGKGITLINDSPTPQTLGNVAVLGIPAGATMAFRGLKFEGGPVKTAFAPNLNWAAAIEVLPSAGSVWIEDCVLQGLYGYIGFGPVDGGPGVHVENVGGLIVQRSTLTGGGGGSHNILQGISSGGDGARIGSTPTFIADSTLTGGGGGFLPNPSGFMSIGNGGHGVANIGASTMIAGCALKGGDQLSNFVAPNTSKAGAGLYAPSGTVLLRDSTCVGGVNSSNPANVFGAIFAAAGVVTSSSTVARSIAISAPVRTNQVITVDVGGVPGDFVLVLTGATAAPTKQAAYEGSLAFALASVGGPIALGTIPAGGTLSTSLIAAPLPPGIDGGTLVVQAVIATPGPTLEAASLYVQVGPNF